MIGLLFFRKPADVPGDAHNFGAEYERNGVTYQHRGNDWPYTYVDYYWPGTTPGKSVRFVNNPEGGVLPFGPFAVCIECDGLYTLFAHGDRLDVALGDIVQPGQILGRTASLGTSTGPHLHTQVCTTPSFPTDIRFSRDFYDFYRPGAPIEEEDMSPAFRGLQAIAWGEYVRMNACFVALAAAGYAVPDSNVGDLNEALVRRFTIAGLSVADVADAAYQAVGGTA